MEEFIATSWWSAYKNYVSNIILPEDAGNSKDISYWRNKVFCDIITYVTPVSILALVPSVFMAVRIGLPVIAISDLVAFSLLIVVMIVRGIPLRARKIMVFAVFYSLSAVLLYYRTSSSAGMLFLLTLTVIASLIYSPKAAYYSVVISTIICAALGVVIYLGINAPFAKDKNLGLWIAISSNLLLLGLVCAHCMNLLLTGMQTTMTAKSISEANLAAIIENTDAYIYSLDKEFRYITFNEALKKSVKGMYDIDVKPGDNVFDFLTKTEPENARFWENIYSQALTGKTVRFEKDFDSGNYHSTTSFSINPILNGNLIIGLSCIATDISDIKQAQLEIKKLNEELERKVTERTSELIAANHELEAFSYSVSHDLRAPLRAVESYAQMLEEDYTGVLDENGKRLLGVIQKSGVKMGNLIDDLLTLSRLGKKEMRKGKVNMNEFTQRITDELTEITPHHAKVIIHPLPFVLADAGLMNHVVTNLLANALKYSAKSEKPQIEIAAREENGEVTFTIADNGVGFDMRYANKLFGVFQRLHADSEFQGTGVGLAIVKRIIERHGGRIWATAEPGKGATFYFTLPAYK